MNGPTLNPDYNEAFAGQTEIAEPECEDCGCDLTGRDVVDDHGMWVCVPCSKADDSMFSADTVRAFEEGRTSWTP
jgi:hypothetical protein